MFDVIKSARTRNTVKSDGLLDLKKFISSIARGDRTCIYVTENGNVYDGTSTYFDREGEETVAAAALEEDGQLREGYTSVANVLAYVPELPEAVSRGDRKGQMPTWKEIVQRLNSHTGAHPGKLSTDTSLLVRFQEGANRLKTAKITAKQ